MIGKLLKSFLDEEEGCCEGINSEFAVNLLGITKGCRPSMHEPDEQGLECEVLNADGSFDNAGCGGEMAVLLKDANGKSFEFDLASLVSFARLGAEVYMSIAKRVHK